MIEKNNKTYKDLLKDPLWVNKSKEIKHLDECECIDCGLSYVANEDNLDVHHTYYDFNKNIYDYDDKNLITLCHSCHTKEHEFGKKINSKLYEYLRSLKKEGLLESQIYDILNYLILQSKQGNTLHEFGKKMFFDRYNYGRIYSRKSRHERVLNEDNETDIWKIICYNNDIKFDSSKTDSTEYQIMWNNYFKD